MTASAIATHTLGKFVWREHMTRDIAASKAFYGGLFGWRFEDAPMEGFTYTLVYSGDKQIAGMMDINAMGDDPMKEHMPSHWGLYVSVDDVDAAAKRALEAGGQVMVGPMDIPNIGRFALVQDPQGAMLFVYKNNGGDGDDSRPENHDFCWESLTTSSADGAVAFYKQVVGWTVAYMEGGDMKTPLFTRDGENWVASVAQPPAETNAPSAWMTYVAVEDLAAANTKARGLGANVLVEAVPVPTVGTFSIMQDPQGAYIAMFQSEPQQAG